MGFAVYHTQKGKGSGGGLGNHIDRTEGKEYSYRTADPEKKNLNQNFEVNKYTKMPLNEAITERIKEGKTSTRKVRKDAVKSLNHILSGSHKDMINIFKDKELSNKWIQENYKFVAEEFGEKNILRFSLHLDEKTPHIHCVTSPITDDGRLSAKEMIGDRNVLKARQTRYADMMQQFGLERGLENSGVKHEDVKDYYKRVEDAQNIALKSDIKPSKGILGNYSSKSVDELFESFKTLKTENAYLKYNISEIKELNNSNLSVKNRLSTENKELKNVVKANNTQMKNLVYKIADEKKLPEVIQKAKNHVERLEKIKTEKQAKKSSKKTRVKIKRKNTNEKSNNLTI